MKIVVAGQIYDCRVHPILIVWEKGEKGEKERQKAINSTPVTEGKENENRWWLHAPGPPNWNDEDRRKVMNEYKKRVVAQEEAADYNHVKICDLCHYPITPPYPNECPKCHSVFDLTAVPQICTSCGQKRVEKPFSALHTPDIQ